MDSTEIILAWLTLGFGTALLANLKGYRARTWFGLGVLLGPLATLILFIQPNKDPDAPDSVSD